MFSVQQLSNSWTDLRVSKLSLDSHRGITTTQTQNKAGYTCNIVFAY